VVRIINLGSGYDPLSLQLVREYKNIHVFDIDREDLSKKEQLYKELAGTDNSRISHVKENANNPNRINKKMIATRTFHEAEKSRNNNNVYFPSESSGWVEVLLLK
jgi:O-methyltransferase involved in polyketide biosynthesis